MASDQEKAVFRDFLKGVIGDIIRSQAEREIRASGRSARSLKSNDIPDGIELLGEDYFEQQEFGLPPLGEGRPGLRYPTIRDIIEWTTYKSSLKNLGSQRPNVAQRIQRGLLERGSRTWQLRRAGNTDAGLPLSKIYERRVRELIPRIESTKALEISKAFDDAYNQ